MANLDSPHWYDGFCNKHLLPSIPCPACLASKDKDLFAVLTPGDQTALEWDENLSPADLLPAGFEYVLKRGETKVSKQTVWRWDLDAFCKLVYSKLGEEAHDFIRRITECDHLVKFPDFFEDGTFLELQNTYDWGDAYFFYHEETGTFYLFHEMSEVLGRDFVNRKMGY